MRRLTLIIISLGALVASCRTERVEIPTESVKNLNGNWRITNATRNGADLTARFDFTQFRLTFTDSAYSLVNPVPFIVSKNGTWAFDDPQYPFSIKFVPTDSSAKVLGLTYPIVNGKRNILLTFSPGCFKNTYQYTFEKEN